MSWAIKQNLIICMVLPSLPTTLLSKVLPPVEPRDTTVEAQVNGGAKVPWHSPQSPSCVGWEWHIPTLLPWLSFSKDLKMGSHTPNALG